MTKSTLISSYLAHSGISNTSKMSKCIIKTFFLPLNSWYNTSLYISISNLISNNFMSLVIYVIHVDSVWQEEEKSLKVFCLVLSALKIMLSNYIYDVIQL